MMGPWAFFLGSPLKVGLWIGNRLVTWTGLLYVWRRVANGPQRWRTFLVWATWINPLSLGVLAGLWYYLLAR